MFEETADLIPGAAAIVLPDAGHYPWYEQPRALKDATDEFGSGLKDSGTTRQSSPALSGARPVSEDSQR